MKILLVNKFFYPRGGDCILTMSTRRLLMAGGHQVRVYAMSYPENIDLPESRDFAPEIRFDGSFPEKFKALRRLLGIDRIKKSFGKVLDDFKPDVVHLHNIHSYLSPTIGELAHRRGIRVVWTLHDYKLLCPVYTCRRPNGDNCEACFTGSVKATVHRCMKGSFIQSIIADLEAHVWNRSRLQQFTDLFITPSRFMHNKMLQAGFARKKIATICNFIDPGKLNLIEQSPEQERGDYFCYAGRLSEEKGVDTMISAAYDTGVDLKIAGTGPLLDELKKKYSSASNIEFTGHLGATEIIGLLKHARASVIPSEWYENNPLGVIESLCCGTPVIGANIGGIPELIDGSNGIVFTSGNAEELAGIFRTFSHRDNFDRKAISSRSIEKFCKETHYKALMQAYQGLIPG